MLFLLVKLPTFDWIQFLENDTTRLIAIAVVVLGIILAVAAPSIVKAIAQDRDSRRKYEHKKRDLQSKIEKKKKRG